MKLFKMDLQLFAEAQAVPSDQTASDAQAQATTTAEQVQPLDKLQQDLQNIENHIAALKADGEALYTDEIASLKAKRDKLIEKIEAEAEKAKETVGTYAAELKVFEQTFWQKYGSDIAHAAEIGLLLWLIVR